MKRPRKKILLTTVVVLLISAFLASTVYAAWVDKNIKAHYRNIKINHNGKPVNIEKGYEPFIIHVNGDSKKPATFVPVRALAEILGKEVKWDQKTYTVDVIDKEEKPDQEIANLMIQLISKENEIKDLNNKISELEAKLAEAEKDKVSKRDLENTENYLRKNYDYYKNIDFDIRLYESKNGIEVSIIVDLDRDYSRWNSLRDRDIEDYIEDIVKEIQYDFKDAKVSGYIEDKRTRDKLVDFYTDTRNRVVTSIKGSSGYIRDLDDMEDYLNNEFGRYEKIDFYIKLSGSKSSVRVEIEVNETDWKNLSVKEQDYYLEGIYDAIVREFSKAEVYGYIDDYRTGKALNDFEFDSNGKLKVW